MKQQAGNRVFSKVKPYQTQNETAPWTGKPLWGKPPAM